MRMASLLVASGVVLVPALACQAADFDGAKPFLCATVDVTSCAPGDSCVRETAGSVSAPQFFTVDAGGKVVSETGTSSSLRSSKIEHIDHQNGTLMLGGTEGTMGWVATVNEATGKLTYAVIGNGTAVVAFGACLAR